MQLIKDYLDFDLLPAVKDNPQECKNCLECSKENGCLRCPEKLFLFLQRQGMSHHGSCLHSCPAGHFGMRGKDMNRCMSEFTKSLLWLGLECTLFEAWCPLAIIGFEAFSHARFFVDNGNMQLCPCKCSNALVFFLFFPECKAQECERCFSKDFCTKCKGGFQLFKGKCFSSCPEGTFPHLTDCVGEFHAAFPIFPSLHGYVEYSVLIGQ